MSTGRHSVSFGARLSSFVGNTMNMCSWILSQPIEIYYQLIITLAKQSSLLQRK